MITLNTCILGAITRLYPSYRFVDTDRVKVIETEYGKFYYSKPLQTYYNIFEQVEDYKIDDIREDDIVLDIGACIGASTLMFARKCKFVYAVEPLFLDELIENLELNHIDNVSVFSFALGSSGVITFCGRKQKVVGCTLSELLKACDPKPTFLKMDCEGGEWSINHEDLAGFRAIEAEIHNFNGEDPQVFIQNMETQGFSVTSYKTKEGQTMISARRK